MAYGINRMTEDLIHLRNMRDKINDRIDRQLEDIETYYRSSGCDEKEIEMYMTAFRRSVKDDI